MFSNKLKELYSVYERRVSPVAFILGFFWDYFTLVRIDLLYDNIVLLIHLAITCISILLINAYDAGRFRKRIPQETAEVIAPFLMQFSFGGLFSAFFLFYSRSGSLQTSWPFLLFIAALLVGNERFRGRYLRITFHISIFFVVLFSYAAFAIPVLLGEMGAKIFLISGFASVGIITAVLLILRHVSPTRFRESRTMLLLSIGGIYCAFNILYFTNIIPPIPLAAKELGVYHSVIKTSANSYAVQYEETPWYDSFVANPIFHRSGSNPVYIYSAVFAPTRLSSNILHRWSRYYEKREEWVETDRLPFPIVGGRGEGYRGYTVKYGVAPGLWRVDVITEQEQLIGRITFTIIQTDASPALKDGIR